MRILKTVWRKRRESSLKCLELWKKSLTMSLTNMLRLMLIIQRNTRDSPKSSCFFKRNMRDSRKVIKIDSMRFGLWTRTRSRQFVRKSRIVIESSTFNSSALPGNHHLIQSSNNLMAQVPVAQEVWLEVKIHLLWTHQSTVCRSLTL